MQNSSRRKKDCFRLLREKHKQTGCQKAGKKVRKFFTTRSWCFWLYSGRIAARPKLKFRSTMTLQRRPQQSKSSEVLILAARLKLRLHSTLMPLHQAYKYSLKLWSTIWKGLPLLAAAAAKVEQSINFGGGCGCDRGWSSNFGCVAD